MICFESISIRNLLSYGNVPTVFDLSQGMVLISGMNGTGKSSLGDAISFALFGKPFRKINIPQLVNSINGQNCVVELSFKIGSDSYRVIRGLKPTKFEIYKNSVLLKQEAAVKDYQAYLETQILKINHKMFISIFVLGSAVFVPFMQLPAGIRRSVIEDLLDINVFGAMSKILKDKIAKTREEIQLIGVKLESAKQESVTQKRLIQTLGVKRDDVLSDLNLELSVVDISLVDACEQKDSLVSKLDTLVCDEFPLNEFEDLRIEMSALKKELSSTEKLLKNLNQMSDCPVCLQGVEHTHKESVGVKLQGDTAAKTREIELHQQKLDALVATRAKYDEIQMARNVVLGSIRSVDTDIKLLQQNRDSILKKIIAASTASVDLQAEQERLRQLGQNALKLIERKNALLVEKQLQDVSLGLLKDTGIKASIIKEYLPLLNKMINKYLSEFDFFINFILDENFDEKLLTRGRDTASYFSLSEGEKKRIDVAILLSFRHIAALKNSAKINMLVLDELDSGLDHESRIKLLELIKSMNTNIWMVSHAIQNTELEQQFDRIAYVQKKGDFTELNFG